MMRRPNLFIVGAPRCGTGSLWSYLKGHPEIFMSEEKELYFFDRDLRSEEWQPPPLQQYLQHFAAAGDQTKLGEASPSYLRSRCAATAIKAFNPSAQIIIMLRNPVDVMYSLHSEALHGREAILDFERALQTDTNRRGRDLVGYREFVDFPEQVRRYFDAFGRENVHTIIYDDLKEDSARVCQNTLRFLGVRVDFAASFPHVNHNRQVRYERVHKVLTQRAGDLRRIAGVLPQWLRSRIALSLFNSNAVVRLRPPMRPELRERLQEEFKPKIGELSKLLGRDLSGWIHESYNGPELEGLRAKPIVSIAPWRT
jgi:hypothetical protein